MNRREFLRMTGLVASAAVLGVGVARSVEPELFSQEYHSGEGLEDELWTPTIENGQVFRMENGYLIGDAERIRITAISGNTITVVRGLS